ncbi:MAG: mechanosensitive ion channel family protein [Cycloclasticus sp.]|nr:mechanosensitive ion channel family protein [Cycloclasticus sp.]
MKRLLLTTLLLLSIGLAFAAENAPQESTKKAVINLIEFSSPQKTFATFLHSMNDIKRGKPERIQQAIQTLDLSAVNSLIRQEKGRDLAWLLLEAIDKTALVNLDNIPNRETGNAYLFKQYDSGSIRIQQVEDGRWLFSPATLAALPAIVDELATKKTLKFDDPESSYLPWHIEFRQQLPQPLRTRSFLLENWKWLGILFAIALGFIADKLASFFLQHFIKQFRRTTQLPALKETPDDLLRPLAMLVMTGIWWACLNLLSLPNQAMVILLVAVKILAGFAGVWGAYRLVDLVTLFLRHQADQTDTKVDDVLVPLISKTLKVFVTVIGITFVASNLNLNVSSLLASLGLGGLAFALAAKDVVQNLFGSITVILDRTFHTGDWIIVNDIEGSVEEVGLRSTHVRTFYDSLVTVPNAVFITAKVDNMGQRRYRRLKCNIALTYDTPPDKIEAFCEGVRELIRLHPYMRKDYYHVYLNSLGASSLDVLVYVFWETPDWATELRERQRFLLDILRLAKAQKVDMAFPTQTLHLLRPEDEVSAQTQRTDAVSLDHLFEDSRLSAREIVSNTAGKAAAVPPPVKF